jgi:uncharacterized protein
VSARRTAMTFACEGETLVGVLHAPARAAAIGVVIIVGGPQYRIGSHRQFVILADDLAGAGFATLRFDYRGMGDSGGAQRDFEAIGTDIAAAVAALKAAVPEVQEVVLWGLCDAATAACFYAAGEAPPAGLVLANPWVRTDAGLARSYVEHYYGARLRDPAFWRRLMTGRMPILRRLREFWQDLVRARGAGLPVPAAALPLPERTRRALGAFRGPALLLLSGADLTAREFDQWLGGIEWAGIRDRSGLTRFDLPTADHTFSQPAACTAVSVATVNWLRGLRPS